MACLSVHMGPFTRLKKDLKRGVPGINRLDHIAKQHDIDYVRAKTKEHKWKADKKMIQAVKNFPGKKNLTEKIVKNIIKVKQPLKL